ncbi:hypothetical protein AVEN_212184-1 [Araneus ventricosus]|uniref:Uncharacterized protein n=1 Tax=Araneus ventricosus TaxID=182803 RepID=A0A4Y2QWN4_ARAVE|nr:hypothetical protein AVEN_212184-1 [Araneus ventricosus]
MGKKKSGPFSGQRIDSSFKRKSFATFFIISRISSKNETFHGLSPFLVEKAITGSVGDVKATKKLRSGDLLIEVESPKQAKEITKLKSLSTIPVAVKPHATLNSSKGVISCGELLNESEEKITEELKSQGVIHISYQEARKLIKSRIPTPGNSYVSAVKKSTAPSTQTNPDISAHSTSKQSVPIPRTPPAITNLSNPSFPSVAPLCENTSISPDLTDFTLVTNRKKLKKDSPSKKNSISTAEKISKFYTTSSRKVTNPIPTNNISSHQSTFKPLETTKPTTVDIELLPMAVLPPLEKRILQSRESGADAEMSSSSLSEEDALEYNMSEDLEDSPAVISPPPTSKPGKADKYKNR